jgi:hypothetical protein
MWLQPWFFSMRTPQSGHFLVCASIHVAFSLSLPHLIVHASSCGQPTGSCASLPHRKQKRVPQVHTAVRTGARATKAFEQDGLGHQAILLLMSTNCCSAKRRHLAAISGGAIAATTPIVTASVQPSECAGHFV